tara:strand:+ start:1617 stop:1829 length:213 start_codon:yes stop_codon:yes gene_type:complete
MSKTTKSKAGKYVCRVGYLEIRQKLNFKKPTEVFVVHKKNAVAGPFKSIEIAIVEAERCINEGIKYSKYK